MDGTLLICLLALIPIIEVVLIKYIIEAYFSQDLYGEWNDSMIGAAAQSAFKSFKKIIKQ